MKSKQITGAVEEAAGTFDRESDPPWVCIKCDHTALRTEGAQLVCPTCKTSHPIVKGIPRFVDSEGYGENFGLEWQAHSRTQLDSFTGLSLSGDRFFESTGWTPAEMKGKRVLEVGCGAGRFTEVVLATEAELTSIDMSLAVEANLANNAGHSNLHIAQADLFQLPLAKQSFDFVFCFGVLQHTPDPEGSFRAIFQYVKPGGRFCVDVYPKDWRGYVHWKYLLRPVTKRIPTHALYRAIDFLAPHLMKVSTPIGKIPKVGRHLQRLIPVADYSTWLNLPHEQLVQWAVLDTFDWFSPSYDAPQSREELNRWVARIDLQKPEIFKRGFYVVRGSRGEA